MSKGNGVAHQVLDKITKFEAAVTAKQQELVAKHNAMAAQLAALEASLSNVSAYSAAELGKSQAQIQLLADTHGKSLAGMDLNVLALAEMTKEMFGHLTQFDLIFKKLHSAVGNLIAEVSPQPDAGGRVRERTAQSTNEAMQKFADALNIADTELGQVKEEALKWHKEVMANAFRRVQAQLEAEAAQQRANEQAAQEELKKAEEAKKEALKVEKELLKAEASDRSVSAGPGGPGASYPDGADFFGGRL